MVNFFRTIRKKLLSEGKTSKYLKYALGEIVLVVIGILIALQINNLNQTRKDKSKEDNYLQNIKRDLTNQIKSIDLQLSYEKDFEANANYLLDKYHSKNGLLIDNTTAEKLNKLTSRKTFIRIDPTFDDLISTGNISLLKDNKLRNELIEYYKELERVEKVIQNNNTLLVDEIYGQKMIDLVYFGKQKSQKLYDTSNEILKNPEKDLAFINLIAFRGKIANLHFNNMLDIKIKTNLVKKHLDNAIKGD